jgi:hypothetical protein
MSQAGELKTKLGQMDSQLSESSRVRLHRSISWCRRAEDERSDHDAQFIFLWIAFNAAYAHEFGFEQAERDLLKTFLGKLLAVDHTRRLHQLVFEKFSGPVRLLIDNKFIFDGFWRALRDHDASDVWERRFDAERKSAFKAVMGQDTLTVLGVIFDRLYVLRNQLVHGGATWNSRVNRQQVSDGASLLRSLLPVILDLMLDHPELDSGGISYPVVQPGIMT